MIETYVNDEDLDMKFYHTTNSLISMMTTNPICICDTTTMFVTLNSLIFGNVFDISNKYSLAYIIERTAESRNCLPRFMVQDMTKHYFIAIAVNANIDKAMQSFSTQSFIKF